MVIRLKKQTDFPGICSGFTERVRKCLLKKPGQGFLRFPPWFNTNLGPSLLVDGLPPPEKGRSNAPAAGSGGWDIAPGQGRNVSNVSQDNRMRGV
jgi:hypothetical protein